ncbi:MAG: phosphoserine transaminase [Alphaproteobacteria bacterium]|nr:phosphoserine transaminase [Alphaproteobacteria bacterium]
MNKPLERPARPFFSSGPTAKPPGWTPDVLRDALLGRSHRAKEGIARLQEVIDRTRNLLSIPADFRIGIVPASDTGAIEMALWSLLGPRPVDVLSWENFGSMWVTDVVDQLKLKDTRVFEAPYGELPDLSAIDQDRDRVFVWNGTTSGVCLPDGDWIGVDRGGLTLCDATSAVFAIPLPWDKLDAVTWSWQKAMGGEGAHGMLVLSPRAVERLESYTPPWPMPKIFRMTKKGKLDETIFQAATINTPSMLCVEDALFSLKWMESIGGVPAVQARSRENLDSVASWVSQSTWAEFLAKDPACRSCTSIVVSIGKGAGLDGDAAAAAPAGIEKLLAAEGVAFDIKNHRAAPPSLRIWGGATVDPADIKALLPWLDWALAEFTKSAAA